jgi:hypothetical protein
MNSILPVILDSFELERCFDGAHSDEIEIPDIRCWSPLPLPQKFPPRGTKDQESVSKHTSRRLAANYMANSRRAMGTMIDLEESARWSCSDDDVRKSAFTAADLMIVHHLEKIK